MRIPPTARSCPQALPRQLDRGDIDISCYANKLSSKNMHQMIWMFPKRGIRGSSLLGSCGIDQTSSIVLFQLDKTLIWCRLEAQDAYVMWGYPTVLELCSAKRLPAPGNPRQSRASSDGLPREHCNKCSISQLSAFFEMCFHVRITF